MGFAITIRMYSDYDYQMTYFVQETNEERAKQKAYQRAKETWDCYMPETLEEFEQREDLGWIEVDAKIEQIIL